MSPWQLLSIISVPGTPYYLWQNVNEPYAFAVTGGPTNPPPPMQLGHLKISAAFAAVGL